MSEKNKKLTRDSLSATESEVLEHLLAKKTGNLPKSDGDVTASDVASSDDVISSVSLRTEKRNRRFKIFKTFVLVFVFLVPLGL